MAEVKQTPQITSKNYQSSGFRRDEKRFRTAFPLAEINFLWFRCLLKLSISRKHRKYQAKNGSRQVGKGWWGKKPLLQQNCNFHTKSSEYQHRTLQQRSMSKNKPLVQAKCNFSTQCIFWNKMKRLPLQKTVQTPRKSRVSEYPAPSPPILPNQIESTVPRSSPARTPH